MRKDSVEKTRKNLPFKLTFLLLIFIVSSSVLFFTGCKKKENKPEPKTVTVNFVDYDGTLLLAKSVQSGTVPTYDKELPAREVEQGYKYEFSGWSTGEVVYSSLPKVYKNTVFKATYSQSRAIYKITFIIDGESTVKDYNYNEIPSYDGEISFVKDGYLIEITGWDKPFTAAKADETYTAIIKKTSSGRVKFIVEEEEIVLSYPMGSVPEYFGTPYKKAGKNVTYEFKGWKLKGSDTVYTGDLPKLTADGVEYEAVFTAVKLQVKVKFINEDKNLLSEENYYCGETPLYSGNTPVKQEDEQYLYKFIGWSIGDTLYKTLPQAYEDLVFTATYEKVLKSYLLTIIYDKGGELTQKTEYVFYGDLYDIASPEIDGYIPDKSSVKGYMTEDATIKVKYNSVLKWDGTSVATSYESGTGTKEDPYIIRTAAQLKYMQTVNSGADKQQYSKGVYYKLVSDLDMSAAFWTPIAHRSAFTNYNWSYFAGVFDGGGHIIKIDCQNASVFGVGLFEGVSGTVKNIIVTGNISSSSRAGGIAYTLGAGGIFDNVKSYVDVNSSGDYVGGMVGMAANGATIKNSINYGKVVSTADKISGGVGGIVGNAFGITVTNSINYGNITAYGRAAGIVGAFFTSAELNIEDCANYGVITTGYNGSAGIIAYASKGSGKIKNCHNYSPITGATYTGGIAGLTECLDIQSCYNKGIIKGTTHVGGIAGKITQGDVTSCENRATVYGKGSSVGGVVGTISVTTKAVYLSDCKNYGFVNNVSASQNSVTGGIAGRAEGKTVNDVLVNATVSDCENHGYVKANKNYVGGIVGALNGGVVNSCTNSGKVYSEGVNVGGIAGSNYGYGAVKNSTNGGDVSGGGTVGKICGQLTSTSTQENCTEGGTTNIID